MTSRLQIDQKQKDIKNSSDQKKQLSPFIKTSAASPVPMIPTQNKFAPITPKKPQPSYSALVQTPVTISQKTTVLPNTQTITPHKPKTATPSFSKKDSSSYIPNPNRQLVKILEEHEEHIYNKGFPTLVDFLFPKNSLFIGSNSKTREYYEAILTYTRSIKVHRMSNSSDPSTIAFSKIHILHILSIQEWKARPYTDKTLSNYPKKSFIQFL